MKRIIRIGACLAAIVPFTVPWAARAAVVRYQVLPGAQYTYFPSPFGGSIAGCNPSSLECAFGISGQFSLEFAGAPNTARFTNAELALAGNEAIQSNPPAIVPVTADRVEAMLAARVFNQVTAGPPSNVYADSQFPGLKITDLLNGTVQFTGGYDTRPADGDALNFELTARVVPEPATFSLLAVAVVFGFGVRAKRGKR